ncbi:hypothetical protein GQ43DRAFT_398612 [Delitschia confertaspora ATCC 74209]|uniref:Uncharacterized protein n=1 Tax=Delitschia confertaspora ATCC 74209 TaxID=1513339 RepID=A0A9P4JMF8_9PLEO|nr:hypothetical protein GQ43DRAFT_398612 [Delitschia confertaspora ATCC 74209]
MKSTIPILALLASIAFTQSFPECTRELARTDECADVINANACYNKNRFRAGTGTLSCIEGKDNAEKSKKVCKCCSCVGKVMCDWATSQKLC